MIIFPGYEIGGRWFNDAVDNKARREKEQQQKREREQEKELSGRFSV